MGQRFTLRIGDHLDTPESKRDFNEKLFTEVAPRYNFITRALSFWRDASWKRDLVARLPPCDGGVCLDLACGTGDIIALLARKHPRARIVGLDITERMLNLAQRRIVADNVRFVRQDMGCLGIGTGCADIVTGGYALRNAPDLEEAIREVRRVLKPAGIGAFLDFSKPRSRLGQRVEYWLLKSWGGFWGLLLHGNPDVYGYVAESLARFPDRVSLREVFRRKGFMVTASRLYFFGVMELLMVRRDGGGGVTHPASFCELRRTRGDALQSVTGRPM